MFHLLLLLGLASPGTASVGSSRDYRQVQEFMRQKAAANPRTTKLFSLGTSGTGDSLDGIQLGTGPVHHLIVATHHGNEYGSTEVALGAITDLAASPIPGVSVFVIPVLNISGFTARRRQESITGTSSITADSNRDYPGPCGSAGPFRVKSTSLLNDFLQTENIIAAATLHTAWPVVAYPWGFSTHDILTAYNQFFIDFAKLATQVSGYPVGNSGQVIYPADGTFEDYAFWKYGIWTLLFELGQNMSPSETELAAMVKANVPGLRNMLTYAPKIRATDHDFKGKCDPMLRFLDRHDE